MNAQRVRIWDLPTRLFHWSLAALVVFSIVTAHVGGAWIDWHFRSGYAVLALVAFRIAWGFVGGRHARFASFLRGPSGVSAALRGEPAPTAGHNPLGGLSVVAMLALVGAQAVGGLFANDDIASEGPLVRLVSKATSDTITTLHRINEKLILALVVLHVAAIVFYLWRKRTNLVRPMITGDKSDVDPAQTARDDTGLRVRAAVLLAICAAAVWWIVKVPA